jgi:CheY-like chemotaxis protein
VARILILEPHSDVRDLIVHVVEHVGHEAVLGEDGTDPVDVMLLEPESPTLRAVAWRVLDRRPQTTVVCVSIGPPTTVSTALAPAVHVLKPFSLGELKQALADALGQPARSARPV